MASGLLGLEETVKKIVRQSEGSQDNRIRQGRINGDMVIIGVRSYPYTLAVDINIKNGMYVWAELYNGTAVIVGA